MGLRKFVSPVSPRFDSWSPRAGSRKVFVKLLALLFVSGLVAVVSPALAQTAAERQASLKGTPPKVAILPVTIHSLENLGYFQEGLLEVLSSRVAAEGKVTVLEKGLVKKSIAQLKGELDLENAKKVGVMNGADFVVFGSLTKVAESAVLILKIEDVKGERPGSSLFLQGKKLEEIFVRVEEMARKINEGISGSSPPALSLERPRKSLPATAGIPTLPAGIPSPDAKRLVAGGEFWQSQPFPFKIKGMAIGDMDGDGRNEVALIDEMNLWIYRWENKEFKLLGKFEGGKLDTYLAVDMGDIDRDGKAEIFVTALEGDRLASFAVAFKDNAFLKVATGLDWHLRVVEWGEKGALLLGQAKGHQKGFEGPVYELGWDGRKYKDLRKAEIPKGINIYGFAPFFREGKRDYLFIDDDFSLKLVDEKGKVVVKSADDYGSANFFQAKPLVVGPGLSFMDADDRAYINVRLIPRGNEILLIRNISATGQFLKRGTTYQKGEVQVLTWTGAMLMANWKSPEITGYLADFQYGDVDGEQGKELILAVNLPRVGFFSGENVSVLMVNRVEGLP